MIGFRSFFILICILWCKFSSMHYCHITQILMFYFYINQIKNFKFHLIHFFDTVFFRSVMLISKYFGISSFFSIINFYFNSMWSEHILCIISLILNVLKCVSWSRKLHILVNVQCDLEKNMCSAVLWWNIL